MKKLLMNFIFPMLLGVFLIPNIILIYTSVSGQGTTYQSLRASYQTKSFWNNAIKGEADKAISYISFTGLDDNKQYVGESEIEVQKEGLKVYLESLQDLPAELICVQDIKIKSYDSYVRGQFDLWFRQENKKLIVRGAIGQEAGKIAIQSSYEIKENKDSIETDWLVDFFDNISTYY